MSNFLPPNYQNFTVLCINVHVVDQTIKSQVPFILHNSNNLDVHRHYTSQLINAYWHDNPLVNLLGLRPDKNVLLQIFMSFGQMETSFEVSLPCFFKVHANDKQPTRFNERNQVLSEVTIEFLCSK